MKPYYKVALVASILAIGVSAKEPVWSSAFRLERDKLELQTRLRS